MSDPKLLDVKIITAMTVDMGVKPYTCVAISVHISEGWIIVELPNGGQVNFREGSVLQFGWVPARLEDAPNE